MLIPREIYYLKYKYLILKLQNRFIGEESTASGQKVQLTDAPTWVIDPIDGTMNFVHGLPHTCISIALLVNKTTEIGIVYNPILEQLFTARKGQGAFYNGAPIHVSGEKGNFWSYFVLQLSKFYFSYFQQFDYCSRPA